MSQGRTESATGNAAAWFGSAPFTPFVREHRLGGSAAFHIFDIRAPAGDFSQPPMRDMVLVYVTSSGFRFQADLGGGAFRSIGAAGRFFVVPPATAARISVGDAHAIRTYVPPLPTLRGILEEVRPGAADPFDLGPLHSRGGRGGLVGELCERLWSEAAQGDDAARLFVDAAVVMLAHALAREAGSPEPRIMAGLAAWQLRRVAQYLQDHLAENVPLAQLAASVGLSSGHFARAFKQATGMPPHQYQVALRIERAKAMLRSTALSVTEIAQGVGYGSPQALARIFAREVGMTPSAWRREALR